MYFAAISAVFLPLFAMTSAAPTQIKRDLLKRTPGNITICTGENYTGSCVTKTWDDWNQCNTLDGELSDFYHNVGTFVPDTGALCRITTSAETCTAHGDLFIEAPGSTNLRDYEGVNYGDTITSFLCQECTSCQGSNSTALFRA